MIRRTLLVASVLLLAGCPWFGGPAPKPSPSIAPTATPTATPAPGVNPATNVFVSGPSIVGGVINVQILDSAKARVSGATVTISGPTCGWGTSDSTDDLQFTPLEGGTYSIRVSAPGYATQELDGLVLNPQTPLGETVTLPPQGGVVTGRVLQGGNPLVGVRVTSGPEGTLTAADGTFSLSGLPSGANTLTLAKTGFVTTSQTVSLSGQNVAVGDLSMTAASAPVVSFENASQPFAGSTVGQALLPLENALASEGCTISNGAANASVRVVASPDQGSVSDATVDQLRSFVSAGGKLILLGDWGGTFNYAPEALNQLAQPYGFAFNSDLVRSSVNAGQPEWIKIAGLSDVLPAPNPMPSGITLFDTCSLFAPPPCIPIAEADSGAYRVASLGGGPMVAIARIYGAGLVIAVGDTVAWASGSITGNGSPDGNLAETNNREFMLNLFSW